MLIATSCWPQATRVWELVPRPRARFSQSARRFVPSPHKMLLRSPALQAWRSIRVSAVRPSAANTRRFMRCARIARTRALPVPLSAKKPQPDNFPNAFLHAPLFAGRFRGCHIYPLTRLQKVPWLGETLRSPLRQERLPSAELSGCWCFAHFLRVVIGWSRSAQWNYAASADVKSNQKRTQSSRSAAVAAMCAVCVAL